MQNPSSLSCYNCSSLLSDRAKFCGMCRTQVRCKECNAPLDSGNEFCIECAAEIIKIGSTDTESFNTISIRETLNERHIEAKFSNEVGKDLTGILRDAMIKSPDGNRLKDSFLAERTVEDADYQVLDKENRQSDPPKSNEQQAGSYDQDIPNYGDILNVTMKALPATEVEWVLIYCFYASNFGKSIFTREDLTLKYEESRRKTAERMQNLSSNIRSLVRSGKLNILTSDYCILEDGITSAKEILSRTKASPQNNHSKKVKDDSSAQTSESSSKSKKKSGKSVAAKRLNDIDFYPEGKQSLDEFYNKFNPKTDYERIFLFVYFMREILEIDSVTYNHIYTCFDNLKIKIPLNVPQITRNSASAQGWIDLTDSKNIQVTIKGRNEMRLRSGK